MKKKFSNDYLFPRLKKILNAQFNIIKVVESIKKGKKQHLIHLKTY